MCRNKLPFVFSETVTSYDDAQTFVTRIPPSIQDKDALLNVLAKELQFPRYFGRNWDALRECLCDLSWVSQHRVVLLHQDLPNLSSSDTANYIDLLQISVQDWKSDGAHELVVVFPVELQQRVLQLWIANANGNENG
jgi:RNAse (barnase) inhibitor barstar